METEYQADIWTRIGPKIDPNWSPADRMTRKQVITKDVSETRSDAFSEQAGFVLKIERIRNMEIWGRVQAS